MNRFIIGFAVVVLVAVIVGIVFLILHLTKCDDKTQFTNDMKSIKLPDAMSYITGGSNYLTNTFINTVYDNNEALIKKIYCNKQTINKQTSNNQQRQRERERET